MAFHIALPNKRGSCLAACAAFITVAAYVPHYANAQAQPAEGAPEGLPAGAFARLGSTRLAHAGQILNVVFSPDGRLIASVGNHIDATLRVWEASTGNLVFRLNLSVTGPAIAFGPNGRMLAVTQRDGCYLYETERWQQHAILPAERATACAFSTDGKVLATWSRVQSILTFWELPSARKLHQLPAGAAHGPSSFAFLPNREELASGTSDGQLKIWNYRTGRELRQYYFSPDPIEYLIADPAGKFLLFQARGGLLHRYELVRAAEPESFFSYTARQGIDLAHDGAYLALGQGTEIHLITFPAGKLHAVLTNASGAKVSSLRFSPADSSLAAGYSDGAVRLWDIGRRAEKVPLLRLPPVSAMAFAETDRELLIASAQGNVSVWDLPTQTVSRELATALRAPVFNQTARTAAGVTSSGQIAVVPLEGRNREPITLSDPPKLPSPTKGFITAIGGRTIAGADHKGNILVWDDETRGSREFGRHGGRADILALSADERSLAAAGPRGDRYDLCIWDVATGKLRSTVPLPRAGPSGQQRLEELRFSHDNRSIFGVAHATISKRAGAASSERRAFQWEAATGKVIRTFGAPEPARLTESCDGFLLAAAYQDGSLEVFEASTGHKLIDFKSAAPARAALCFSRSSAILASAGPLGTVYLWRLFPESDSAVPRAPALDDAALWRDLLSENGPTVYAALGALMRRGDATVAFLETQLQVPQPVSRAALEKLVGDLDAELFSRREAAFRQLEALQGQAEPLLRASLATPKSIEQRLRLEQLLTKLRPYPATPNILREERCVFVLQRIASRRAEQLLQRLADGAAGCSVTEASKEALQRLRVLRQHR